MLKATVLIERLIADVNESAYKRGFDAGAEISAKERAEAYAEGYAACMQEIEEAASAAQSSILAPADGGSVEAPPPEVEEPATGFGLNALMSQLGPSSARALQYVLEHPGASASAIEKEAQVRGKGVVQNLVRAGLLRKHIGARDDAGIYVRFYPVMEAIQQ